MIYKRKQHVMLNFSEFELYENWQRPTIDPLVRDFLEFLKANSGTGNFSTEKDFFTIWWCESEENFINFTETGDSALNWSYEAEQRKLPESEKNITPFYLIEIIHNKGNSHEYKLIGIDAKNKNLVLHKMEKSLENEIIQIFDNLIKKYYPTQRAAKKYGLS